MRRTVCTAARSAALALGIALGVSNAAHGSLETTGFRAVGVAVSENPISAIAVASLSVSWKRTWRSATYAGTRSRWIRSRVA